MVSSKLLTLAFNTTLCSSACAVALEEEIVFPLAAPFAVLVGSVILRGSAEVKVDNSMAEALSEIVLDFFLPSNT